MTLLVPQDLIPTLHQVVDRLGPGLRERGISLEWSGAAPPFPHHAAYLVDALSRVVDRIGRQLSPGGTVSITVSKTDVAVEIRISGRGESEPSGERRQNDAAVQVARLVARLHGGLLVEETGPVLGLRIHLPLHGSEASDQQSRLVLGAVHRIARRLFDRPELDDLLPEVILAGMEAVEATAGTIWMHDPTDDTLVFQHGFGGRAGALHGYRMPSTRGIAGAVYHSGQSMVTGDPGSDVRHTEVAHDFMTRQLVTVPLYSSGDRPIGILQMLNKAADQDFTADHDLVILETLGSLAATAIANARQQEERRKAAVADAVGDIAHDLKNMMASLEAWSQMIEPLLPPARQELNHLREARNGTGLRDDLKDLLDMVPELMHCVRVKSQEVQDRGAEIADALRGQIRDPIFVIENVVRTIDRAARTLRPLAQSRGVALILEGSCAPFPHDRTHVFHAVYNLLMNAIHFTPPGGSVRIGLRATEAHAEIQVVDTGHGMSPEVAAVLFTERTISMRKGGTGLGTQIVARVARIHGGSVTVDSEIGRGTTILLRLARRHLDRDESATAASSRAVRVTESEHQDSKP